MESTRDAILRLLAEHGQRSAGDLADELGLSAGSVRRHVDILLADGLLEAELARQPRGRPVTRYSLSDEGEERSAAPSYSRLLERIYPALAGLEASDVEGSGGADVLDRVFDRVAEGVAEEHRGRVTGVELGERVRQVTEALSEEGILHDAAEEEDLFRLQNLGCPYRSAAAGTHAACVADRRAIELLLDAPVEQLRTVAQGAPICEYVVLKAGALKSNDGGRVLA
jgi:predicted ArsR family transcriptional regulator